MSKLNLNYPWENFPLEVFKTTDFATLFYYQQKASCVSKGNVLFLMGWSQGPDVFSPVILTNDFLRENYDIHILTGRGFNLVPDEYGATTERYAKDVKEYIETFNLKKLVVIAHSMGCAVIWDFINLFGQNYFDLHVFIDQSINVLINPAYTEKQKLEYGSIFSSEALFNFYNQLLISQEACDIAKSAFEPSFFTKKFLEEQPETYAKILAQALKYQNIQSANVVFEHVSKKYQNDVLIKRIERPSLLIGGTVSIFPAESIIYSSQYFDINEVKIFTEEQGGSHFMFLENYPLFNNYVNEFIKKYHKH